LRIALASRGPLGVAAAGAAQLGGARSARRQLSFSQRLSCRRCPWGSLRNCIGWLGQTVISVNILYQPALILTHRSKHVLF
jgi:hypothetical protein